MIDEEEFRCSEETATQMLNEHAKVERPLDQPSVAFQAALGIPMKVSVDVPVGRLQFWRDDQMVREIIL